MDLAQIVKLIRVKHWVKNAVVFLPAFFAGKAELILSESVLLTFLSFCLVASSIYVLNDLVDIEHDRSNPNKKDRPLASGAVSEKQGKGILAALLLVAALIISLFYHEAMLCVLAYFVLNIAYSFKLKQIAIIDVTCISLGFILRVVAGSLAAAVLLSHWIIIMIFLLMISIAFAKRRDDFVVKMDESKARLSKSGYSIQFLDVAKSVSFSITLVAYLLYTLSPDVQERLGTDKLYLTSLFVFLGIMRYLQVSMVFENASSPVKLIFKDMFIQAVLILWILSFTLVIYGNSF